MQKGERQTACKEPVAAARCCIGRTEVGQVAWGEHRQEGGWGQGRVGRGGAGQGRAGVE